MLNIAINRHENIETRLCKFEQSSIFTTTPSNFGHRSDGVTRERSTQPGVDAFI